MPRGQPPYHASNPPERICQPTHSRSAAAVSAATADSNAPTPVTNKKKKNSLIAAQIVPPVQTPVGSQVVEKPAEKVRAVATSLMTAAVVSSSLVPVKDAKSGGEKVSMESANDDASVSSSDSSCSGSSGNLLHPRLPIHQNLHFAPLATLLWLMNLVGSRPVFYRHHFQLLKRSMVPELHTVNHLIMLPLLRRITMLMMCTWK